MVNKQSKKYGGMWETFGWGKASIAYIYVKLNSDWQIEAQSVNWCRFRKSEQPENPQMGGFCPEIIFGLRKNDFP